MVVDYFDVILWLWLWSYVREHLYPNQITLPWQLFHVDNDLTLNGTAAHNEPKPNLDEPRAPDRGIVISFLNCQPLQ